MDRGALYGGWFPARLLPALSRLQTLFSTAGFGSLPQFTPQQRRTRRGRLLNPRFGFVVGLRAEARIAARSGCLVAAGGGTPEGAAQAAHSLIEQGADALVSFGLAGGLDPYLAAGALVVPNGVLSDGETFTVDSAVAGLFGGATGHRLLAEHAIVTTVDEKQTLFHDTGAHAVDLESGSVAQVAAKFRLPFAVVRAICDPAGRPLPPAASVALDSHGAIAPLRVASSIARQPWQIAGLVTLTRDAAAARATLIRVIAGLRLDEAG